MYWQRNKSSLATKFSWQDAFLGFGGIIFLLAIALISIGIWYIHSASSRHEHNLGYAYKQLRWLCIGLAAFLFVLLIDYKWLLKYSFLIYGFALFLLILTAMTGTYRGGAKRWIKIGPALLQTSDVMKLAIILILAKVLSRQRENRTLLDLVFPYLLTVVPMGLIVLQPDLGTSLVFVPIATVMIFAAGAPIKHLMLLLLVALNLAPIVYYMGLHEYQRNRVKMFFFQNAMTQEQKKGSGYHLIQSKIAHGNGGLWGKGWRQGTQNVQNFLPERHTDFIFSVIGEERGFVGTTVVLLLYFLLYFFMLLQAYTTPAPAGQLITIGIMTLLCTQTIVNTCMTVGLAPITGLPLPFLSYGGSSLLFNLLSIALIISINGRKEIR